MSAADRPYLSGWVSIAEVSSVRLRAKTAAFSVTVNVILNLIFVSAPRQT